MVKNHVQRYELNSIIPARKKVSFLVSVGLFVQYLGIVV